MPALDQRALAALALALPLLAVSFPATHVALLAYPPEHLALARLPVAEVASSLYLVPVLTFPIAWVWLGEAPSAPSFGGGAIALAGVLLVQLKGR